MIPDRKVSARMEIDDDRFDRVDVGDVGGDGPSIIARDYTVIERSSDSGGMSEWTTMGTGWVIASTTTTPLRLALNVHFVITVDSQSGGT